VVPPTAVGHARPLRGLFGDRVGGIALEERNYVSGTHSPEHYSEWFRQFYGPITK
jgi:hypothetical protein